MIPYHIFDCQLVIDISMSTCNLPHAIDYSAYCRIRSQLVVVAFLIHNTHLVFSLIFMSQALNTKNSRILSDLIMSGLSAMLSYFRHILCFYENDMNIYKIALCNTFNI